MTTETANWREKAIEAAHARATTEAEYRRDQEYARALERRDEFITNLVKLGIPQPEILDGMREAAKHGTGLGALLDDVMFEPSRHDHVTLSRLHEPCGRWVTVGEHIYCEGRGINQWPVEVELGMALLVDVNDQYHACGRSEGDLNYVEISEQESGPMAVPPIVVPFDERIAVALERLADSLSAERSFNVNRP